MRNFINLLVLKTLVRDERGVSALEYAILAGMIVGVVTVALAGFGDGLATSFTALTTKLTNAINSAGT